MQRDGPPQLVGAFYFPEELGDVVALGQALVGPGLGPYWLRWSGR